jgi:hypothetical protein
VLGHEGNPRHRAVEYEHTWGAWRSRLAHQVVVLGVAGSNPVAPPTNTKAADAHGFEYSCASFGNETRHVPKASARSFGYAPVAQLDRAPVFGTGGWGFESLRACSHDAGQTTLVVWLVLMTCPNGENATSLRSQTPKLLEEEPGLRVPKSAFQAWPRFLMMLPTGYSPPTNTKHSRLHPLKHDVREANSIRARSVRKLQATQWLIEFPGSASRSSPLTPDSVLHSRWTGDPPPSPTNTRFSGELGDTYPISGARAVLRIVPSSLILSSLLCYQYGSNSSRSGSWSSASHYSAGREEDACILLR